MKGVEVGGVYEEEKKQGGWVGGGCERVEVCVYVRLCVCGGERGCVLCVGVCACLTVLLHL